MTPGEFKRYKAGQVTLDGTTEATLTVSTLEADSVVLPVVNTVAGTAEAVYVSTKNTSNGTIGLKSAAGNTSTVDIFVLP